MTKAEPVQRALALIERRLFEPITLGEIAAESGLSPFHFSRLFTALHGQSAMAHMRRRRLIAAAGRLLAGPGLALVDLALAAGSSPSRPSPAPSPACSASRLAASAGRAFPSRPEETQP